MSFAKLMARNTSYNENVRAYYIEPKEEFLLQEEVKNTKYLTDIHSLVDAYEVATNQNITNITNPELTTSPEYLKKHAMLFHGKDGTSDAYTKRGKDNEFMEYMERQMTQGQAWRFETSNSYLNFLAGGKIIIGKKQYTIVLVINQLGVGNIPNALHVRNNPDMLENWGVKTLILS